MRHGIVRIDQESMFAGDMSGPFNLWDDSGVRPEGCRLNYASGKNRIGDALDAVRLSQRQFTSGVVDRHSAAYAGARRAPVDFAFGKDANVSAVIYV